MFLRHCSLARREPDAEERKAHSYAANTADGAQCRGGAERAA